MLRLGVKFQIIAAACNPFPQTLQSVRWRRKPRWLPTAKSKVFRVPPRPQIPEEEKREIQRLYNNYRTQIKSIRRYLTETYNVKYLASSNVELQKEDFEADYARCSEINDKWNNEVKIVREQRLAKELEYHISLAKKRLEERLEINSLKLEKAEQEVRSEKELSKTFITPDKLDAAIEYAINNPIDYNFAIDLDGNKIVGRETNPTIVKEDTIKQ